MSGLTHLALAVREPLRSLTFYRDVIGITGRARTEDYGFVISTPNCVDFTVFRGEPPQHLGDFHFGVALADADAVRAARRRLQALGVVEHEWCEEAQYVSVKVVDPDGYLVGLSWDGDPAA